MNSNYTSKSCSLRFLNGMRNFCMPPTFLSAKGTTYSYITLYSVVFELAASMGSYGLIVF